MFYDMLTVSTRQYMPFTFSINCVVGMLYLLTKILMEINYIGLD